LATHVNKDFQKMDSELTVATEFRLKLRTWNRACKA